MKTKSFKLSFFDKISRVRIYLILVILTASLTILSGTFSQAVAQRNMPEFWLEETFAIIGNTDIDDDQAAQEHLGGATPDEFWKGVEADRRWLQKFSDELFPTWSEVANKITTYSLTYGQIQTMQQVSKDPAYQSILDNLFTFLSDKQVVYNPGVFVLLDLDGDGQRNDPDTLELVDKRIKSLLWLHEQGISIDVVFLQSAIEKETKSLKSPTPLAEPLYTGGSLTGKPYTIQDRARDASWFTSYVLKSIDNYNQNPKTKKPFNLNDLSFALIYAGAIKELPNWRERLDVFAQEMVVLQEEMNPIPVKVSAILYESPADNMLNYQTYSNDNRKSDSQPLGAEPLNQALAYTKNELQEWLPGVKAGWLVATGNYMGKGRNGDYPADIAKLMLTDSTTLLMEQPDFTAPDIIFWDDFQGVFELDLPPDPEVLTSMGIFQHLYQLWQNWSTAKTE